MYYWILLTSTSVYAAATETTTGASEVAPIKCLACGLAFIDPTEDGVIIFYIEIYLFYILLLR